MQYLVCNHCYAINVMVIIMSDIDIDIDIYIDIDVLLTGCSGRDIYIFTSESH